MSTIFTPAEYQALPDRTQTTTYVVDRSYRDPSSPDFIFVYRGERRDAGSEWQAYHWLPRWQSDTASSG
jgi:hypothetical protein